MAKRLMVTGCGGFVAGGIVHQSDKHWELHALTRGAPLLEKDNVVWHSFDLLDTAELRRVFREVAPDAVIHAAAAADIDFCQANRELAERVNTGVARELADLCGAAGAKLVSMSTDNVYDGEKGRYTEVDPTSPINWYGETKVMAEQAVSAMDAGWVVVRVSLVMGLPMLGAGNSFLSRMLPVLERGETLGVPDMEIRSPLDIVTAARALLELADNDYSGYLQLAGNDILNRFEMVRRLAVELGYPAERVEPKDPVNIPDRAPRPRDASLCNDKAKRVLKTPMRGLGDGLALILATQKEGPA
ncbi:MAG: sugar nucleotide-binding protein [Nitrospiraceae bacterium]|nr:sugar nucleotide-binding protein [Nitrospiraceae bacterium]